MSTAVKLCCEIHFHSILGLHGSSAIGWDSTSLLQLAAVYNIVTESKFVLKFRRIKKFSPTTIKFVLIANTPQKILMASYCVVPLTAYIHANVYSKQCAQDT